MSAAILESQYVGGGGKLICRRQFWRANISTAAILESQYFDGGGNFGEPIF
jgi:hypothetical protein